MFEVFVTVALLALIIGVLTVLVRLTRTRDKVWTNQQLLYEIINEQRELRTQIQLTVTESRKISEALYSIDELIGRSTDKVIQVQKNLNTALWEKLE